MQSLPVEIQSEIVLYLKPDDYYSLSTTCRWYSELLNSEAIRNNFMKSSFTVKIRRNVAYTNLCVDYIVSKNGYLQSAIIYDCFDTDRSLESLMKKGYIYSYNGGNLDTKIPIRKNAISGILTRDNLEAKFTNGKLEYIKYINDDSISIPFDNGMPQSPDKLKCPGLRVGRFEYQLNDRRVRDVLFIMDIDYRSRFYINYLYDIDRGIYILDDLSVLVSGYLKHREVIYNPELDKHYDEINHEHVDDVTYSNFILR